MAVGMVLGLVEAEGLDSRPHTFCSVPSAGKMSGPQQLWGLGWAARACEPTSRWHA